MTISFVCVDFSIHLCVTNAAPLKQFKFVTMCVSKICLIGYTLHGRECVVHFEYGPPIFVVN